MFLQKIESAKAPKAIGPYSPGVKLGDFVYLSGMLPVDPDTGFMPETIEEQTAQVMKNIQGLLSDQGLELRHIVKTTVFVTDLGEFSKMNEVYASYFDARYPYPARSCVQVAALPKGAKLEIECLVLDTLTYERQMHQGCSGCGGSSGCGSECCEGDCGCSE